MIMDAIPYAILHWKCYECGVGINPTYELWFYSARYGTIPFCSVRCVEDFEKADVERRVLEDQHKEDNDVSRRRKE